jgi:hypothetical protein
MLRISGGIRALILLEWQHFYKAFAGRSHSSIVFVFSELRTSKTAYFV